MRKKQIFLSHAWGIDEYGRNNHNRVKVLFKYNCNTL